MTIRVRPAHLRLAVPASFLRVSVFPLANLFLSIIPFLLLCASFEPLAAAPVDVGAPRNGDSSGQPQVKLTVSIGPTLFVVTAQSPDLSAMEIRSLTAHIARNTDSTALLQNSYEALSRTLYDIKQRYPASVTAALVPADSVPYEDVIATIDVLRSRLVMHGYRAVREPLFADVTLGATR